MTDTTETTLHLSSHGFPDHATPKDYDHWIGYVIQKIEDKAGYPVDAIRAEPWGQGEVAARMEGSTHGREILEALNLLWEEFRGDWLPVPSAAPVAEEDVP